MIVVAGEALIDALEAEQRAKISQSEGYFKSEELCALQAEQSRRSIIGVEIVESNYGCSIRYDSGLQNFSLLAGSRDGTLDGSLSDAERFAKEWVARDSDRRYAWRRKNGALK